ncbi:unnamed protein product [Adineta ricciae]|uniref:Uncharacterized protein n=1 Tax=Adineta ricciae TaxID=249248 RepID=A0A815YT84_ADIRI|nr:unnamed protein product [Adineta ricciae]CAF1574594.1 unnamed protein product [Adineta ricciae]
MKIFSCSIVLGKLGLTVDGVKKCTKFGPKPTHPIGIRRIGLDLANYINKTGSSTSDNSLTNVNATQLLCRRCFEKETSGMRHFNNLDLNFKVEKMEVEEGCIWSEDEKGTPKASDVIEAEREYAVRKLNEVLKIFNLEPIVPRNTIQSKEKIDKVHRMLQEWLNCVITTSKLVPIVSSQQRTTLKPQTTIERRSSIDFSASEIEDFFHRLRCLFKKSSYHEQCTSHQARAAISQRTEHDDFSKPTDHRGNKSLDIKTQQTIQDFYLDDEISRQSPNTKDTRIAKDIGVVVIRYFHIKVSRSKFFTLRPYWIRQDCSHQVCMCIQHQNIDLLLTALNKKLKACLVASELIDKTVCADPSEDCYFNRCDECCNGKVSDLFANGYNFDEQFHISWSLWTTRNNHVELQHFTSSFNTIIDELNSRWSSFITHTYITRKQPHYIKSIKLNSSLTTYSVVHVDFAENFTFVAQNEVQSAYWSQKQATVYTVVTQTGADHRNMVLISNRMTHDTAFVCCTQKIIVAFIREEYPNVHKIHYVRYETT